MSVDNIGVSSAPGYSPAIKSEKAALTTSSQLPEASAATLGARLATLEQQLNALPAGAHRDKMLQIYQNLLEAGQSFEKLSGKALNDVPLQEKKPVLEQARAGVEKSVKMLADNARVIPGKNSPAAREASAENLNNAHKQLKTSQNVYSRHQQSAVNQSWQQLKSVMTGDFAQNINSAHKQPESSRPAQGQPQRSQADPLEQQLKAAMTGGFAQNLSNTYKPSETEQRLRTRQKRAADTSGPQAMAAPQASRSAQTAIPMPRLPPVPVSPRPPYFPDAPIPRNPDDISPWEPGGDFAMFWGMQQQIGLINTNYIKTYQYIMGGYTPPNPMPPYDPEFPPDYPDPATTPEGGYTEFFKDLSDAMNDKVNYLKASKESGQIIFEYHAFKAHFDTQMAKYFSTAPSSTVPDPANPGKLIYRYPLTFIKFYPDMTDTQRTELLAYWTNNLNEGFYLERDGNNGIQVWIDTTIVKNMSDSILTSFDNGSGPGSGPTDMMQQIYSAFETKWNGNQNTVSGIVQRITDLYSSSNRIFDNLVRIMTSAFQSCVDCAKEFLRV